MKRLFSRRQSSPATPTSAPAASGLPAAKPAKDQVLRIRIPAARVHVPEHPSPVSAQHLQGMGLVELVEALDFADVPYEVRRKHGKISFGDGNIEADDGGFKYTQYDYKNGSLISRMYISYSSPRVSEDVDRASFFIAVGEGSGQSFTPRELLDSQWPQMLVPMMIAAWQHRHGELAFRSEQLARDNADVRSRLLAAQISP